MHSSANRIAAVLFDMDGVLIDSNAVIERGWAEGAQMFGKTLTEEDIVRHIHGQPGPHTIRALFSDLSLKIERRSSHISSTLKIPLITTRSLELANLSRRCIRLASVWGLSLAAGGRKSIVLWRCCKSRPAFQ